MSDGIAAKAEERWEHVGLECCVVRNPFGGLNGYVRMPEPFRSRKLHYDDLGVEVNGGLTYGMDEAGWVGWDTCHSWDNWLDEDEIKPSMREFLTRNEPGRCWGKPGVIAENDRLAEQIARWCEANPDFEGEFTEAERIEQSRAALREFVGTRGGASLTSDGPTDGACA